MGLRALEGVVSEEVVVPESFYPAFRTALAGTGPFRVSNLNATTPAHIERLLAAATLRELGYEVYIPHDPAATSMLSNLEFSEVIKLARLSEQPKEHGSNHSSNPITKYQANELWGITRGNPWSWRVNTGRASKNFVTQLGGFLEYFFSAAVSFVHKSVEGASALASRAVGSPAEGTNTTERTLWVLPRPSLTVKVRVDSPVVVVNSTHMVSICLSGFALLLGLLICFGVYILSDPIPTTREQQVDVLSPAPTACGKGLGFPCQSRSNFQFTSPLICGRQCSFGNSQISMGSGGFVLPNER